MMMWRVVLHTVIMIEAIQQERKKLNLKEKRKEKNLQEAEKNTQSVRVYEREGEGGREEREQERRKRCGQMSSVCENEWKNTVSGGEGQKREREGRERAL